MTTQGHVFIATSLDGYIARRDGNIDWLTQYPTGSEDHGYNAFIAGMDGIVMGSGSFAAVLTFAEWPYPKPVVVLSRTLAQRDLRSDLAGKVRILSQTPREAMTTLGAEGWRHAYMDGGKLIQSFLRDNLIADMVLTHIPVLPGDGLSLFGTTDADIAFRHIETRTFPSGLVQSKYETRR